MGFISSRSGRRAALGACVALGALGASTSVASARSVFVNDDGPVSTTRTSCARPESRTVQDGVNRAAPGDTVVVCAGEYREQVRITKRLALVGTGNPAIRPPAVLAGRGALVDVFGGSGVVVRIEDLTVGGVFQGAPATRDYVGILTAEGATTNVRRVRVEDVRPTNDAVGSFGGIGTGIAFGNFDGEASTPGLGSVDQSTIVRYGKTGVSIGEAGTRATVDRSAISGLPDGDPIVATNGVQVGFDAQALVQRNTIEDNRFTGGTSDVFSASGVVLTNLNESSVRIERNTFDDNDGAVLLDGANGARVERNSATDNVDFGVALFAAGDSGDPMFPGGPSSDNVIERNAISTTGIDGLFVEEGSVSNLLSRNSVSGSREHDCHDDNPGARPDGPNIWERNAATTEFPDGICNPDDADEDGDGEERPSPSER